MSRGVACGPPTETNWRAEDHKVEPGEWDTQRADKYDKPTQKALGKAGYMPFSTDQYGTIFYRKQG